MLIICGLRSRPALRSGPPAPSAPRREGLVRQPAELTAHLDRNTLAPLRLAVEYVAPSLRAQPIVRRVRVRLLERSANAEALQTAAQGFEQQPVACAPDREGHRRHPNAGQRRAELV